MDDHQIIKSDAYLTSTAAAKHAAFTNDYISRLCRLGKLDGKKVGTQWYVTADSLAAFLSKNTALKDRRRKELSAERKQDYSLQRQPERPNFSWIFVERLLYAPATAFVIAFLVVGSVSAYWLGDDPEIHHVRAALNEYVQDTAVAFLDKVVATRAALNTYSKPIPEDVTAQVGDSVGGVETFIREVTGAWAQIRNTFRGVASLFGRSTDEAEIVDSTTVAVQTSADPVATTSIPRGSARNVLLGGDANLSFNANVRVSDSLLVTGPSTVSGQLNATGGIVTNNRDIDAGTGRVFASNVINTITPGNRRIRITGTPQNPIISALGGGGGGSSGGVTTFLELSDTPGTFTANHLFFTDSGGSSVTSSSDFTFDGTILSTPQIAITSATATSTVTAGLEVGTLAVTSSTATSTFAGGIQLSGGCFAGSNGICITGTIGSTGGINLWATSTDELLIYPTDPSDVVVVGGSATTTTGNIFEVIGSSLFDDIIALNATITNATTTTSYISSFLGINNEYINDLTGDGLTVSNNALTVATTTLGLGDGTYVGLSDTPGTITANAIQFGNSGATALTQSSTFVFDGTNLGIGTTSPYATLSVAGETVAEYFTATSTTASSTLPLLSVTNQSALGTVISGIWQGSTIDELYGGTGTSSPSQFLFGDGNNIVSTSTIARNFLDGSIIFEEEIDTYSELNTIVSDVTLTHNGLIDTSSELRGIVTDETGTGLLVFNTEPTLQGFISTASSTITGDLTVTGTFITNTLTSEAGTTTFTNGVQATGSLDINGSATSTFAAGIDIESGCFAINGSCITAASLGGITAIGPTGQTQTGNTILFASTTPDSSTGLSSGLTITGAGDEITFDTSLTGTLSVGSGGTGSTTPSQFLFGDGAGSLISTSTIAQNFIDDAIARDTELHDAVTLAGSLDYLTLSGQEITRNAIDLTTDVTGTLPIGSGGTGLTSVGASSTVLVSTGVANAYQALDFNYIGGTLGVSQGGTGSTSPSGFFYGPNNGTLISTTSISSAFIDSGNLTETGSSILTITGGTNAVLGSGTTIQVAEADTSTSGFLSSSNFTLFNNKVSSTSIDTSAELIALLTDESGSTGVVPFFNLSGQAFGDLIRWNGTDWTNIATSTLGIALSDTTGTLTVSRGGTGSTTPSGLLYGDGAGGLISTTTLSIFQGGTGLSTAPSFGQLLIGQADGTYGLQATSTLGLFGSVSDIPLAEGYIFRGESGFAEATSTIFVADSGYVGVGTESPSSQVEIITSNSGIPGLSLVSEDNTNESTGAALVGSYQGESTRGALLQLRKSRGTFSSPTDVLSSGEVIGTIAFQGRGSGAFRTIAEIEAKAKSSFGSNAYPSELNFYTHDNSGNSATTLALTIDENQNVGIGTTTPGHRLSVAGNILGNEIIGSFFTGTTTATSSLAGGLDVGAINQTGSATSTFANGIQLSGGCFLLQDGNCAISSASAGITQIGPAGQLQSGSTITFASTTPDSSTGLSSGLTITGAGDEITFDTSLMGTLSVGSGGTGTTSPSGFLYGPNDGTLVSTTTISQNFIDDAIARDTELHDAVTLAGSLDYLTLSGQEITRNAIDLTTDVTGTLPVGSGGTGTTTPSGLLYGDGAGGLVSTTTLSIFQGGTGLSTAPSFGQLLVGQADGTYGLQATSTLGLFGSVSDISLTEGYTFVGDPSNTASATSTLFISQAGNVGVGTSSPSSKLTVYGNALLEGATRYLNFGTTTGGTGYGIRDNSGLLQYRDLGGSWAAFSEDGPFTSVPSSGNYDVSSATFDSIALSVAAQETSPQDMLFNNDGTTLYVIGDNGQDINAYTLSTAYDISTATFDSIALSVSGQETVPRGMLFNNDGTTLYVIGSTGDDINEYTLSTAYDISTAIFDSIALSVSGQDTVPVSMLFNDDGTTLYMLGYTGQDINAYSLSTAYDISTATFDSIVLSVSGQETEPFDMLFNNDGTKLYVLGFAGDDINEYTLSTAYDISTATFDSIALSVSGQETEPIAMIFNEGGATFYVLGWTGDDINAYTIPITAGRIYATDTTQSLGIGITTPTSKLTVRTTGTTDILNLFEAGGEEVFTVLESGNVGIGTTSPYAKLSVAGETVAEYFTATSTSATSTFNGGLDVEGGLQLTTLLSSPLLSTDAAGNVISTTSISSAFIDSGNLTETGSSILTITGGTNAVLGSGATIQVAESSSSQDGFLSSANFTVFNNKVSSTSIDQSSELADLLTDENGSTGVFPLFNLAGQAFGDLIRWNGTDWTNIATSTLGIALSDTTGTLAVSRGGTGTTTPSGLLYGDGVGGLVSTTTLSIFQGGTGISTAPSFGQLLVGQANGTYGLQATSTLGLFGSVSDISLTQGYILSGDSSNQAAATSSLFVATSEFVGIGDTDPDAHFEVSANNTIGGNIFLLSSDDTKDGDLLLVTEAGNVGIGTTSPGTLLSIGDTNGINFTTATSTFSSTGGINLSSGCFAINGTCAASSADLHDAVTLAGSLDYLTISGQEITRNAIDLTTDVTGTLPIGNGGTGSTTPSGLLYGDGAGGLVSTTTLSIFQGGTGLSTAPSFGQLLVGQAGGTYGLQATSTLGLGDGTFLGLIDTPSTFTANRVLFESASSVTDSADFTFDGTILTAPVFSASSGTGTSTFAGGLTVDTSDFVVDPDAGRVGIGTVSPSELFHIAAPGSSAAARIGADSDSSSASHTASYIHFSNDGSAFNTYFGLGDDADSDLLGTSVIGIPANTFITQRNAGNFAWVEGGEVRLLIDGNGNVGIGTTSPYAALSVVGEAVFETFNATSTTASSTIAHGLNVGAINQTGSATSTFASGVSVAGGIAATSLLSCDTVDTDANGNFVCGSDNGGGSGSVTTLEEDDVGVGDPDIVTIDFGTGFDLSESPNTEVNITLDLVEYGGPASTTLVSIFDTLYVGGTATTTITGDTSTSTFAGGIATNGTLDVHSTSATSTFANGIQLSGGCFLLQDGNCAISSASAGITQIGPAGQLQSGSTITFASTTPDSSTGLSSGLTITGSGDEITFDTSLTGTLSVGSGGTGSTSPSQFFYGPNDGTLISTSTIAQNFIDDAIARDTELHDAVTLAGSLDYLTLSGQEITRNAIDLTTDVTGTLPIGSGGTNATSFSDHTLIAFNGTSLVSSSTIALQSFNATSTTASSTIAHGLNVGAINQTGSATSTFANGIQLSGGCFLLQDGNCAISSASAGITQIGPAGQLQSGSTITFASTTPDSSTGLSSGLTITGAGDEITFDTSLTGTLSVGSGGTGTTSPSGFLYGPNDGTLVSTTSISSAFIDSGDLTEIGSSILTITGGTNAVLGSGTTIQVAEADTSTSGFLSSANFTMFNNKVSSTSIDQSSELADLLTDETGSAGVFPLFNLAGQAFGDLIRWNGTDWTNIATSTLGIALSDTTGTLTVSRGGTGSTTPSHFLYGDGAGSLVSTSTIAQNFIDDAIARDTELHDAVTLAGSLDYLTLSGQEITRNAIDLTTDVTGTLPIGNGGTGLTAVGASSTVLVSTGVANAYQALDFNYIGGTLGVSQGGTGTTTPSGLLYGDGAGGLVSTTTLAIFQGGTGLSTAPSFGQLLVGQADGTYGLQATSTLGLGSGTYVSLADTPGSITANAIQFGNSGGTELTQSSTFVFDGTSLGVGVSSPSYPIEISGDVRATGLIDASRFVATSSSATSTFAGGVDVTGTLRARGPVDQTALGLDRLDLGVQDGTPRIVFEDSGFTNWLIDNSAGVFRWYTPGVERLTLDTSGNLDLSTGGLEVGGTSVLTSGRALQNLTGINSSGTITFSGLSDGVVQAVSGVLSATSSISGAFIEDVFLRNDQDDTTTGQLTAQNFVASSGTGTSTFAGGLTVDTSDFVVDPDAGRVGIGTTSPERPLHIVKSGGDADLKVTEFQNTAFGVQWLTEKARGTSGSPSAVLDNDELGKFYFYGYDGNSFELGGGLKMEVDGSVSDGSLPTRLVFETNDGSGQTERVRIDNAGNVGISTTSPGTLLSVGDTSGINFTTATSTFSSTGGINLSNGCFAINGTCAASSADLHDAVTLAGSLDYLTISGQEITRNAIDLTTDVTGTLPIGNGGTGLTAVGASSTVLVSTGAANAYQALDFGYIGGTLGVSQGGTGSTTPSGLLYGDGAGGLVSTTTLSIFQGGTGLSTAPSFGQLLVGQADGTYGLQATSSLGLPLADTWGPTVIVAANNSASTTRAHLVADGTNDEIEIQAAIDSLPSSGGTVQLLEGDFNVGAATITIPSYVTLTGLGASSTVLYLADGANTNVLSLNSATRSTVKDLKIDGNDVGNTSGVGITYNGANSIHIENVYVFDTASYGIQNHLSPFSQIRNSRIESAGSEGIRVYGSDAVAISNNTITSNAGAGIHYVASGSEYGFIEGNYIASNAARGLDGGGASGDDSELVVSGNVFVNNTTYNVQLDDNTTLTGNQIIQTSNAGNAILVNQDRNTIISNVIVNSHASGLDGIVIASTADNTVIAGNNIRIANTSSQKISDEGTNTQYAQPERITITTADSDFGAATTSLVITQSGSGDIVNFFDGTSEVFTILDGGNVGISTTSPGTLLSVGDTSGINFTTATSTFSSTGGINLSNGCFAINGTCAASSADLHDAVTLAGSLDYLTISGQEITRNAIDLTTDVTGTLPIGNGGTNATSFSDHTLIAFDGTSLVSTSTIAFQSFNATSTTASSTIAHGLNVGAINQTGSATSTFVGGVSVDGGIRATSLISCDTIDTDANGNFMCGSDASGGTSFGQAWEIDANGNLAPTTTIAVHLPGALYASSTALIDGAVTISDILTVTTFDATSTSATSTIAGGFNVGSGGLVYDFSSTNVGIGTAAPNNKLTVSGTADITGNLGIGTTSPGAVLSVAGDTILDSNRITLASTTASALTIDYTTAATSTIPDGQLYAWTLATSTTATPILAIDTSGSGDEGQATTTINGGVLVDSGAITHDYSSGVTSIDNIELGNLSFEANAGVVSLIDLPVTTTVANVVQSYAAQLDGTPILTVYGITDGAGTLQDTGVAIGTSTPSALLTVFDVTTTAGTLFNVVDTSSSTLFAVLDTGFVGIGTTTPGTLFSVDGVANLTTGTSTFYTGFTAPVFSATNTSATSTFAGGITVDGGIKAISLLSCDTVDTDANGNFICGSDASGGGVSFGQAWELTAAADALAPTTTVGIIISASSTINSNFSVYGDTILDASLITFASTSASTLTVDYAAAATSTIPDGQLYAWTLATSTTATPILSIDTSGSGGEGQATTTINGGVLVDSGAITHDYGSGITSIDNLELGALTFEDNAGVVSWVDLPVSTTTASLVQSYTAQLDGTPILTVYGITDGSGTVQDSGVALGTSTPSAQLTVWDATSTVGTLFNVVSQASSTLFSVLDTGNVGIGTTSPTQQLSVSNLLYVGGSGTSTIENNLEVLGGIQVGNSSLYLDTDSIENLSGTLGIQPSGGTIQFGGSSNTTLTLDYAAAATSTIASSQLYSFTLATSTTATPIFAIDTTGSGGEGQATTTINGGVDINSGAIQYDYGANKTSIERLDLGPISFDDDAGVVSWVDLPVTSNAPAGTAESYSAQIDSNQILTVYSQADGAGGITDVRVVVGTSTDTVLGSSNIPYGSFIIADGALCVDDGSADNCDDSSLARGQIYAESASVTPIDIAENFPTFDQDLAAGELVMLDPEHIAHVKEFDVEVAGENPSFVGVVSTKPGLLLGGFGENATTTATSSRQVPIALAGRVPVVINGEGGDVAIGDYLTFSSVPGVATRATSTTAFGVALQAYDAGSATTSTSSILVLVGSNRASGLAADGIGTTTTDALSITGQVVAQSFINLSTEGSKKDIEHISDDYRSSLFSLARQLNVATYRYLEEEDDVPPRIGLIAEETPSEILSVDREGVDLYKLSTITLVGVQELADKVDSIEEVLGYTASTTDATAIREGFFALMLDFMKTLGVEITEGFTRITNLITDGLTVGSAEKPTGITIYDEVTGLPYCMKVHNGNLISEPGECGSSTAETPPDTGGAGGGGGTDAGGEENAGGGSEEGSGGAEEGSGEGSSEEGTEGDGSEDTDSGDGGSESGSGEEGGGTESGGGDGESGGEESPSGDDGSSGGDSSGDSDSGDSGGDSDGDSGEDSGGSDDGGDSDGGTAGSEGGDSA